MTERTALSAAPHAVAGTAAPWDSWWNAEAKSIYKDSKLSVNINSRVGPAVSSQLASSRAALSTSRCLGPLLMACIDA